MYMTEWTDGWTDRYMDKFINTSVIMCSFCRSLQPSSQSKGKHLIHVLDTPGFQHRELAGCEEGASFDDLCMNYARVRMDV